jgi:stearoyl-CoA desaturase (delta-9 desaturase)
MDIEQTDRAMHLIQPDHAANVADDSAMEHAPSMWSAVRRWFDTDDRAGVDDALSNKIDWARAVPFIFLHVACVGVFWVGFSPVALFVAGALYAIRMFALTGFYHRYFSHRSFRTSRTVQFIFAVIGASCVQRGPLWWASHHRGHHRHADTERDPHSPAKVGFLWSHMGWFLTPRAFRTDWSRIPDLSKQAELRWLDRFDIAVPILLGAALFGFGALINRIEPKWGTSGAQMLVWGFFVSTVVLFHITVTINSLAHRFGSRRFDTADDSRNNVWLALLTFGEGWHNNHLFYPGSVRQGFRWWEVDITWYLLRLMAAVGLVWDLKPVPVWVAGKERH